MSQSLTHARHNKDACDFLHTDGGYPDWVITTAFYSAMHYAYCIIFPCSEGGKSYNDIESYSNDNKIAPTKHGITTSLVIKKYFSISANYKLLKDAAHTARYHDFNHPPEVVGKIRRALDKISIFCEAEYMRKNPPSPTTPAPDP